MTSCVVLAAFGGLSVHKNVRLTSSLAAALQAAILTILQRVGVVSFAHGTLNNNVLVRRVQ